MQAMAKTANSKVIFLPAQSELYQLYATTKPTANDVLDQTVQSQLAQAEQYGEGPSKYADHNATGNSTGEFGNNTAGWQNAVSASVVEHI